MKFSKEDLAKQIKVLSLSFLIFVIVNDRLIHISLKNNRKRKKKN